MGKAAISVIVIIFTIFILQGCESKSSSITANYETLRAKNVELTDGSETLARISASKDKNGKIIVTVKDKNGVVIGTISAK